MDRVVDNRIPDLVPNQCQKFRAIIAQSPHTNEIVAATEVRCRNAATEWQTVVDNATGKTSIIETCKDCRKEAAEYNYFDENDPYGAYI